MRLDKDGRRMIPEEKGKPKHNSSPAHIRLAIYMLHKFRNVGELTLSKIFKFKSTSPIRSAISRDGSAPLWWFSKHTIGFDAGDVDRALSWLEDKKYILRDDRKEILTFLIDDLEAMNKKNRGLRYKQCYHIPILKDMRDKL